VADDVEVSEAGRGEVEPPAAAISDSFPSFGDENSGKGLTAAVWKTLRMA